jgi:uncharacterized membrane protein
VQRRGLWCYHSRLMHKGRLEAFSDGVIAIIITIMVLELKPPHGSELADLATLWPRLLSYVLSFIFIGIYWNNHHHLLQAAKHVDGRVLWANLHLLFWLSLIPFVTDWMGENHFAALPVASYGFLLLSCGGAYWLLAQSLIRRHGRDSTLARAIGTDRKGLISLVCYLASVPLAFVSTWISGALFVTVALVWLIPDTRIEKVLSAE